ncbi:pyridoxal-phosphate dependent enzyme [Streptomyces sp. NPDC006512]|uniref:threonine ammonia-lyase n=1 Tax=Streptomyces sp. NPDC006512 TaxID=3154307 RepID=UPI0033A0B65E
MTGTTLRGGALAAPMGRRDVRRAASRLAPHVVRTPVIRADFPDRPACVRLWLKAENLQRGGSFKIRGALHAVGRMAATGCPGVIAPSTGNHGIAVAYAARAHGLPAVLVLPADAAPSKVRGIRATGARVVLAGTAPAERAAVVAELGERYGYRTVDPYEDPDVVAGQATATAELLAQVTAAGGRLDAVVVPVGGGSALAGACLAAEGTGIAVVAAEPAAVPALGAALRAGAPVTVTPRPTIADGLRPDRIGRLPFALVRRRVTAVVEVEEDAIADTMRLALERLRLVVEPAAATALAGALRFAAGGEGRAAGMTDVGVLLSGGNVESALIASLLLSGEVHRSHRGT